MFQNKSFIILSVRQDLKRSFTIVVVPLLTTSRIKFCKNKTKRIRRIVRMEVASLVRIFLIHYCWWSFLDSVQIQEGGLLKACKYLQNKWMFCFTEFVVFVVTSYKYMWDVGTPHNEIMSSNSNESEPGVRYLLTLELYFLVLPTMYVLSWIFFSTVTQLLLEGWCLVLGL